ncbi:hypothetical protein MMC30_006234 [Trapelia coarctata]|nr:hypothetical protein [Trapelia coarctata]
MATSDENPLIKALPPATDYLTYLTIVEYNLTKERLPVLHGILQDTELTSNIGWDLVQILLPLLPESEECLHVVAKLGNPREVILKATELLESVGKEAEDYDEEKEEGRGKDGQETGPTSYMLPSVLQFTTLLRVISILHPRIKTKQPSRFLATTIEAILPAYARLGHSPSATQAVLSLMDSLSRANRPQLPPRVSESTVPLASTGESAPDPEASSTLIVDEDESLLQSSLLQSFLTHVTEIYVDSLPPVADSSGMAWSARVYEILHPEKIVPFRISVVSQFKENADLRERDETVLQLLNRAQYGLSLDWGEVMWTAKLPESEFLKHSEMAHLGLSPPSLVASRGGIMYLLAAQTLLRLLDSTEKYGLDVLYPETVRSYIGDSELDGIGTEPLPLIDSVLALGFPALHDDEGHSNKMSDVDFHKYLQRLSLLSANTPASNLRFNAHVLTSAILHAHPSPQIRYNFIRDTLQHCPYESLKVSAVGWLKDEILAAAGPKQSDHVTERPRESKQDLTTTQADSTLFSKPETLLDICLLVFPSAAVRDLGDIPEFLLQVPFFLASLNLLYLLCSSVVLREKLDVSRVIDLVGLDAEFVMPLVQVTGDFKEVLLGQDGGGGDAGAALADIELLEDALGRVRGAGVSGSDKRVGTGGQLPGEPAVET